MRQWWCRLGEGKEEGSGVRKRRGEEAEGGKEEVEK